MAQPTLINKTRSYTAIGQVYTGGVVTGATNATPIVVTTTSTNNLVAGDQVQITGITTNTAANGVFYVNPLTATTFQLYSNAALTTGVAGNGAYGSGGAVSLATNISAVTGDWTLRLRVDALAAACNCVVAFQDSVDGFVSDIRTIATAAFTGANYQFSATVSPQFTGTDSSREWRRYDLMAARFGVASAAIRVYVQEYDAGAGLVLTAWYEN
jgi:hypothetical protein